MFTRLADKTGGRITPRGRFAPGYPTLYQPVDLFSRAALQNTGSGRRSPRKDTAVYDLMSGAVILAENPKL